MAASNEKLLCLLKLTNELLRHEEERSMLLLERLNKLEAQVKQQEEHIQGCPCAAIREEMRGMFIVFQTKFVQTLNEKLEEFSLSTEPNKGSQKKTRGKCASVPLKKRKLADAQEEPELKAARVCE